MIKIKNNISKKRIIFSDLDGSFLNEDNFTYGNNVELVKKLLREDNFIVFNSSKTYIEIKEFLEDINIDLPFICENGGGIYAPKDIFPKNHRYRDRFCIINESDRIKNNNKFDFEEIKKIFSNKVIFLKDLSVGEQIKLSGLDKKKLLSAMNREFTEIVIMNSCENIQKDFITYLNIRNLNISKGGRFHHISSKFNKGQAMLRLVNEFKKYYSNIEYITIAIGDSNNDLEMLNAADFSCLIKNRSNNELVKQIDCSNLYISKNSAPYAWEEYIENYLVKI